MSDINKNFLDEVAGRNLLLNSEELIFLKRTNQEVERLPSYMGVTNPIKMTNGLNTTYFNPIERYSEDYVEGQEYTWSFLINYKGAKGVHPQIYVGDGTSYRDMIGTPLENNWVKMTYTFKAIGSRKSRRLHLSLAGYEEVYLAEFKLEKGTLASDWTPAPEDVNSKKYVKNTRYGINKILAYYYPSVKGSEKDTYLFLNHLNNSIYTTNYKIALCLTLIENEKFNMTRFQELKSKINHLSKYIYSLEKLIRYTLENKIYIKD